MEHIEKKKTTSILLIALRILALLIVISIFVPGMNAAKVSDLVNKNMSLFTTGTSYSSIISGFGRTIKKGWVQVSTLKILFSGSMIACLGIIVIGIGACLSLGERKLKWLGSRLILFSCIGSFIGLAGIYLSYSQLTGSNNLKKILPQVPGGFYILGIAILLLLIINSLLMALLEKPLAGDVYEMQPKYKLFLMLLPFIVLTFVFSYLPLWGWRYSFYDYRVGGTLSKDNFVGLKWFTYLFQNASTKRDVVQVVKNTLAMSGLGIATSWLPMGFAIFLSEIKNTRYKHFVQTFTTIPNFVSWVLVYGVAVAIFSTDGFLSSFLMHMGIIDKGINFLMSSNHTWLKMLAWGIWKGVGWSAIIYIAAISGIDQQLYEAATVDGAGRFQRMWHITVPALLPTYCVLLLLAIAGILNNGMDQYLVFENANNTKYIQVLDLYVYKLGIGNGIIPMSTVIGMVKSLVSVILLFTANRISKFARGESIV